MSFTDPFFLFIFLPFITFLYYLSGNLHKKIILLFASLFFYYWIDAHFFIFFLASAIYFYLTGILLNGIKKSYQVPIISRTFLCVSLSVGISLLILAKFHIGFEHLPLGISFFIFQGIAYLLDINNKKIKIETNLLNFSLYYAFFPKLLSGPVTTYQQMHQDLLSNRATFVHFSEGIERFFFGLGKKILIADVLAATTNQIFNQNPTTISFSLAWLGILAYSLQIYFDFSGYSDMAIGIATIFGYRLPENFNYPYLSTSISDFWTRWHISLSNWFKTYIYIPLGGNRKGLARTILHTSIIFLLCGLWHGTEWHYIIWGGWHAFWLIIERIVREKKLQSPPKFIRYFYTMIIVLSGWILFKSPTLSFAGEYFRALIIPQYSILSLGSFFSIKTYCIIFVSMICCLPLWKRYKERTITLITPNNKQLRLLFSIITLSVGCIIFFESIKMIGTNTSMPFVYALF